MLYTGAKLLKATANSGFQCPERFLFRNFKNAL